MQAEKTTRYVMPIYCGLRYERFRDRTGDLRGDYLYLKGVGPSEQGAGPESACLMMVVGSWPGGCPSG
jgi:hypothetical protein